MFLQISGISSNSIIPSKIASLYPSIIATGVFNSCVTLEIKFFLKASDFFVFLIHFLIEH